MPSVSELSLLGFSDTEARVYLDLAEIGKSTPQIISKRTGIPRTTVYWALDNLTGRGLVSLEQKRASSFYAINQPSSLVRMVQDDRRKLDSELQKKEQIARELAEAIQPLFKGRGILLPKLQFFEGKQAVDSLLYDYLPIWQKSIAEYDWTWWGYQDPSFAEHYLEWLKFGWENRGPKEIYKVVTNEIGIEKNLKKARPDRRMKYIPAQYKFSSTIWVLGEYVVLIKTSQRPHYAYQLHDKEFAENLRLVFQMSWDLAL